MPSPVEPEPGTAAAHDSAETWQLRLYVAGETPRAAAALANLVENASTAQKIIAEAVGRMPAARGCACGRALEHAIITRPEHVPAAAKRALAPIIGKYLPTS